MRYGHLVIKEESGRAYLLGYDLCLTPTEYKVLRAILEGGRVTLEALIELCDIKSCGRGNIPVHVCAINKKAQEISQRKLILYAEHNYYINEFM